MLPWEQLQSIAALERHKTMARAAAELSSTPATISRHIDRASYHLDSPLFSKDSNEWLPSALALRLAGAATDIERFRSKKRAKSVTDYIRLNVRNSVVFRHFPELIPQLAKKGIHIEATLGNLCPGFDETDIAIGFEPVINPIMVQRTIGTIEFAAAYSTRHSKEPNEWVSIGYVAETIGHEVALLKHMGKDPQARCYFDDLIVSTMHQEPWIGLLPKRVIKEDPDLVQIGGAQLESTCPVWLRHVDGAENIEYVADLIGQTFQN